MIRATVLFAMIWLAGCATAGPSTPVSVPPGHRTYASPGQGWSIAYPAAWVLDDRNTAYVRVVNRAAPPAMCGIHSASGPFQSVDELTEIVMSRARQSMAANGLRATSGPIQRITLWPGVAANDVTTSIEPGGGRSRRIFVLHGRRGFVIDCETYARNWAAVEAVFQGIIESFRPGT